MHYNEKIALLRRQKSLTQQQLADEIGTSRQMIIRWEKGLNIPSMYYAQRLADFFGVEISALLDDSPLKNEAPSAQNTTNVTKKTVKSLAGKSVFIAVASFLPVALFFAFSSAVEAVRQYLILQGFSRATDYRLVTDGLSKAGNIVCAALCAMLLSWWIGALVGYFCSERDKFLRLSAYNWWKIGCLFIFANTLVCLWEFWGLISLPLFVEYLCALVFAVTLIGGFDVAFKRFAKNLITVHTNKSLIFLINVFTWIAVGLFSAFFILSLICAFTPHVSAIMAFGLFVLLFSAIGLLAIVAYTVLRIILQKREQNKAE